MLAKRNEDIWEKDEEEEKVPYKMDGTPFTLAH
jgi:hypothetical protein